LYRLTHLKTNDKLKKVRCKSTLSKKKKSEISTVVSVPFCSERRVEARGRSVVRMHERMLIAWKRVHSKDSRKEEGMDSGMGTRITGDPHILLEYE